MASIAKFLPVAAFLALCLPTQGLAELRTVCTITVNSSDEAQAFKRALPSDRFRFVELVERGRPDWLASACHKGVQCDILLVSGHYNSEGVFFSDRVDGIEHLPIAELERVACSESCPGLLDRLRQVYLFGCNSLNNDALKRAGEEIARSLVRAGHSAADAARLQRVLAARLGESSRARMSRIFKDVPVLYGFSGVAPLGPVAGAVLDRYFRSAGAAEVGSSRASARLLAHFADHAMVSARGITDTDQEAAYRSDVCPFVDDRLSAARKAAFVHEVLRRDITEVRMHLDRIERFTEELEDVDRQTTDLATSLEAIASDASARERYLAFARDSDEPAAGARMVGVAQRLGWLSEAEQRTEWMRILRERLARGAGPADVDLACRLNSDGNLDGERHGLESASGSPAARRAMLACLGATDARVMVLASLSNSRGVELEMAEVLLHRRPVSGISEFRLLATEIARMEAPDSQARALNALARQPVPDRESVVVLAELFPLAKSLGVQRAIAGVLLRSDYGALRGTSLARTLSEHRLRSPDGRDVIDILIRQLEDPR